MRDIRTYIEGTIVPLIAERHPEVAPQMSILIGGSFGLGIADELSDLDANIYLDDPLWKRHGGQLGVAMK